MDQKQTPVTYKAVLEDAVDYMTRNITLQSAKQIIVQQCKCNCGSFKCRTDPASIQIIEAGKEDSEGIGAVGILNFQDGGVVRDQLILSKEGPHHRLRLAEEICH